MASLAEFETWAADVLSRLVLICINDGMPCKLGSRVVRWARDREGALWVAWNDDRDAQSVASDLYHLSADYV